MMVQYDVYRLNVSQLPLSECGDELVNDRSEHKMIGAQIHFHHTVLSRHDI